MKKLWVTLFMAVFLIVVGCGGKPSPPLPSDLTIVTLVNALERQAEMVGSFSAWARVRVKDGKDEQKATAIIKYVRPDRFKVNLLGFGGAEIAEIGSQGDSIIVYIPYYNGYIITPKGVDPLRALMPALDVDLEKMISLIEGPAPPPDALDDFAITMRSSRHEAELAMERDGMQYRYTVRGPQLLVTEETIEYEGNLVRRVSRSDFMPVNGAPFPRRIEFEEGDKSLTLDFSGLSINSDFSEDVFAVKIPKGAEELRPRY